MAGLDGAIDRLEAAGYTADLLLTKDETTVETQTRKALAQRDYDVIVVGAGLRTLQPMALQFG